MVVKKPSQTLHFSDHFSIAIQNVLFFGINGMEPQKLQYEIRHFPGVSACFSDFLVA